MHIAKQQISRTDLRNLFVFSLQNSLSHRLLIIGTFYHLSLLPLQINKYAQHTTIRTDYHDNYHKYHIIKISAVFSRRPLPLTGHIVRGRCIPLHHRPEGVYRHHVDIERPLLRAEPGQTVVGGRGELVVGRGRSFRHDWGHGRAGGTGVGGAAGSALAATPFRAWDDEEEGYQAAEGGDVPDYGPGVQSGFVVWLRGGFTWK